MGRPLPVLRLPGGFRVNELLSPKFDASVAVRVANGGVQSVRRTLAQDQNTPRNVFEIALWCRRF